MVIYRRSRNTDPPGVVDLWNDCLASRGAYPIRTAAHLERWLFSRCYFQFDDLILALDEETAKPVGLALSGFGPNEDRTGLGTLGVICLILVHPNHRGKGIGRELHAQARQNLLSRGATEVVVGSQWPNNPYLFGLYGGSNSPGILASEPDAASFLAKLGYQPAETVLVLQKKLDTPLTVADTRFSMLRRRYDAQVHRVAAIGSWWQDCQWGMLEPVEMRLVDKLTSLPAARLVIWELEGFSWKWGMPAAGLLDIQVRPDLRRLGLGKLLVAQALRFLQDQFFAVAELQISAADPIGLGLAQSVGFEEVDRGYVFRHGRAA